MAFLVVVAQCLVATILVEAGRRMGYATYDPFNFATAKRWLPVSLCFSAMLFTSFKALEVMNVPMVSKRAFRVDLICRLGLIWAVWLLSFDCVVGCAWLAFVGMYVCLRRPR